MVINTLLEHLEHAFHTKVVGTKPNSTTTKQYVLREIYVYTYPDTYPDGIERNKLNFVAFICRKKNRDDSGYLNVIPFNNYTKKILSLNSFDINRYSKLEKIYNKIKI
jgi:hypothetical protein